MSAYPIVVEADVRTHLRDFVRSRFTRFVVLTDANVATYARRLTRGIKGRLAVEAFALGEPRKTMRTLEGVLDRLFATGADRSTAVVGVGGGIAADLFGLAAALFMRGVPYIHVSTSLVAMADASIGGKTGVNLRAGKNLAGRFADPIAVFDHVDALWTLPYRHFREGLAELVKHAIVEGGDAFEAFETLAPHPFARWPWETIVGQSVAIKSMIVADDRTEQGAREVLNLGHTFGHAIERASGFRTSHGAAVSIGLRAAGLLALQTGRFSREEHLRVVTLLLLLRMPLRLRIDPKRVFDAMAADKKKRRGRLRFVLPRAIGDVEYGVTVPDRFVKKVLARLPREPGGDEFR